MRIHAALTLTVHNEATRVIPTTGIVLIDPLYSAAGILIYLSVDRRHINSYVSSNSAIRSGFRGACIWAVRCRE